MYYLTQRQLELLKEATFADRHSILNTIELNQFVGEYATEKEQKRFVRKIKEGI